MGCKISFLLGVFSLFEGAVQPENRCILVKKGKKQVAKSQKNVQKVCKKHAKRRHLARFLHVFLTEITVMCVIDTCYFEGVFCWVKFINFTSTYFLLPLRFFASLRMTMRGFMQLFSVGKILNISNFIRFALSDVSGKQ